MGRDDLEVVNTKEVISITLPTRGEAKLDLIGVNGRTVTKSTGDSIRFTLG